MRVQKRMGYIVADLMGTVGDLYITAEENADLAKDPLFISAQAHVAAAIESLQAIKLS
jgi:hypothetical protein